MAELEVLEAHVPVRTPRLVREEETATTRLAPIATWFSGPVFSRARDIFAANMTELLDPSRGSGENDPNDHSRNGRELWSMFGLRRHVRSRT